MIFGRAERGRVSRWRRNAEQDGKEQNENHEKRKTIVRLLLLTCVTIGDDDRRFLTHSRNLGSCCRAAGLHFFKLTQQHVVVDLEIFETFAQLDILVYVRLHAFLQRIHVLLLLTATLLSRYLILDFSSNLFQNLLLAFAQRQLTRHVMTLLHESALLFFGEQERSRARQFLRTKTTQEWPAIVVELLRERGSRVGSRFRDLMRLD